MKIQDLVGNENARRRGSEKYKALLAEFDAANTVVVRAMEKSHAWLEKELLPPSKGSYAIGADGRNDRRVTTDSPPR